MERVRVVVDGWGALASETTGRLRRCGVAVRAGAHEADASELALVAGLPGPDLVVLVAEHGPPEWWSAPWLGAPWQAHDVALLPVVHHGAGVDVGPLVVPRRTPCLVCVTPPPRVASPAATLGDGAVVLAAAVATVTALATLAGDHSLGAVSTEIGPRGTTVVHRVWTSRPGCPCASVRMAG
ncbi:hypothetical protein [Arthrobacter sp. NEB 688]|uniref:hypothetical protein n=1 Tax=Arthrobacter sp. NEB 688 TaxID=904039 RepID=UPI001563D7AE|nr:hypothetical protein [Arthrobacter sp. NEB 688]QKE84032.1 hypothetical protein HL663_08835 [Arthrobacter sp. NEB 688]